MKKGDKFKLSYDWWNRDRPKGLLPSGLGAALKAYEHAAEEFDKALKRKNHSTPIMDVFQKADDALEDVDKARLKAIKLCMATFPIEKDVLKNGVQTIIAEKND